VRVVRIYYISYAGDAEGGFGGRTSRLHSSDWWGPHKTLFVVFSSRAVAPQPSEIIYNIVRGDGSDDDDDGAVKWTVAGR